MRRPCSQNGREGEGLHFPPPCPVQGRNPICALRLQLPICIMGEGGHVISSSFWLHLFTTM